jgi:TolA-binding protein
VAYYQPLRIYDEALNLFELQKYAAAHESFARYLSDNRSKEATIEMNARYYSSLCALYLTQPDAEFQLEKFIRDYPESPWCGRAYWELARFNYQRKHFKAALEWFLKIETNELKENELSEYHYKRGQCYFERKDIQSARMDFAVSKKYESEYKSPSIYYYSHILYVSDDLQSALDGFLTIQNDARFSATLPEYITTIYHRQRKWSEVIDYAVPQLEQDKLDKEKSKAHLSRMIGDAYFRLADYNGAEKYLQIYISTIDKATISLEDYYQLGVAQMNIGKFEAAVSNLSKCNSNNDKLHMMASYKLGDCYLKLGKKEYARNAFEQASKMDFDNDVQEDAMFNYAKLAFELSFNPFHEAIDAFESYLKKYPNSSRHDEAYEFLLNVYMKTKAYERALAALDQIREKDLRIRQAYQVVAYNRGVELFRSENYTRADSLFKRSMLYPVDANIHAECIFWQAEISYRSQKYEKAIEMYNQFLVTPGARTSSLMPLAEYGLGYSNFKLGTASTADNDALVYYRNARSAFERYCANTTISNRKQLGDAYARSADCHFAEKSYLKAVEDYDKAVQSGMAGKEYAVFQKAMCYGFAEMPEKKSWVLKNLLQDSPNSKFEVEAKYEIARTYLLQDRLVEAREYFTQVLNAHATSHFAKFAMRDMCLVMVKESKTEELRAHWEQIKSRYKNDAVVCDAYVICKGLLIEDSNFQSDARLICGATQSEVEQEVYLKAVAPAQEGNCELGITKLSEYLRNFQPAYYRLDANYYLAQCYARNNNRDKCLEACNEVVSLGSSAYLEDCLVMAGDISFEIKDYSQAITHYRDLEQIAASKTNVLKAQLGLLESHYNRKENTDALQYVERVLANPDVKPEIAEHAKLIKARILMNDNRLAEAKIIFQELINAPGETGPEACYSLSKCMYKLNECKETEKQLFDCISQFSSWEDWKFRSFLLLADVYVCLKDEFQAIATIDAILENTKTDWVIAEANAKKNALVLPVIETPAPASTEGEEEENPNELFPEENND